MKKKVLKIQVGEAFDKETKRSFPVYQTAWQQEDGTYTISHKVFVSEVEIKDKERVSKQAKIEA